MLGPRTFLFLAYAATAIPILSSARHHLLQAKAPLTLQHVFRKLERALPRGSIFDMSILAQSNQIVQEKMEPVQKPTCGMRLTATQAPPPPTTCPDNNCRHGASGFMRLPVYTPTTPTPEPLAKLGATKAQPAGRPRLPALPQQTDL